MIKIICDQGIKKMQASGNVLEIATDFICCIDQVYKSFKTKDEEEAEVFIDFIKSGVKAVCDNKFPEDEDLIRDVKCKKKSVSGIERLGKALEELEETLKKLDEALGQEKEDSEECEAEA